MIVKKVFQLLAVDEVERKILRNEIGVYNNPVDYIFHVNSEDEVKHVEKLIQKATAAEG